MTDRPDVLLDTDVLSQLVRTPAGGVAEQIARIGEGRVATSVVVAGELRYGARRSGSSALKARVEAILERTRVVPLGANVGRTYAEIRATLAGAGTTIGPNDLWIAAHALTLGASLATGNLREFQRVPGLRIEPWLAH